MWWWEVSWVRSGVGDGVRCNRAGSDGSSRVVPSSVGEVRRGEGRWYIIKSNVALGCIDAHFGNDGDVAREGEVVAHECDEVFNVVTGEDLVGIVAVGAFSKDGRVLCRGICRVKVSRGES